MVTLYGEIRTQQDKNQKEGYKKLRYKDHYFFKLKKKTYWSYLQTTIDFTLRWYRQWSHCFFCPCFDTSITIYHHLFHDLFCLNKDVHQYNTRLCSNVHEYQARTNYQLKHSIYSGEKLTLIFSTRKKTRISVYKRIYIND